MLNKKGNNAEAENSYYSDDPDNKEYLEMQKRRNMFKVKQDNVCGLIQELTIEENGERRTEKWKHPTMESRELIYVLRDHKVSDEAIYASIKATAVKVFPEPVQKVRRMPDIQGVAPTTYA